MDIEFKGCPTGKRIHYTRSRAKHWVKSRQEIHKKKRVRVYRCEECGFFHATSYNAGQAARIRDRIKEGK